MKDVAAALHTLYNCHELVRFRPTVTIITMLHISSLRANPDKSIFGTNVLDYLGHNLSTFSISPPPSQVGGDHGAVAAK